MLFTIKGQTVRRVSFFLVENLLIFVAVLISVAIRFSLKGENPFEYEGLYYKAILIAAIYQVCFYYNDLYDLSLEKRPIEWIINLIQSMAVAAIMLALVYFLFPGLIIGRGIFLLTLLLMPLVVIGWRLGYDRLSRIRPLRDRVLIIGTGPLAKKIGSEILESYRSIYDVVGFIDENPNRVGESVINPKVVGDYSMLLEVIERDRIDRVIVALPDRRGKLPVNALLHCKFKGTHVDDGVSFYERLVGKILVDNLRPSWFIFSTGFQRFRITQLTKRLVDIVTATVALLVTSPIFLVLAILIPMDSRGAVFIHQKRVGEGGKVFTLIKFRSMLADAEAQTGPIWAQKNDLRITRLGRFLRRSRLDELPQLINVLKGDMSFVGPRPERPFFVRQLQKEIPYYSVRHTVKPGVTGWAQIRFSYAASRHDAMEKLQFDLFYIKHLSIWLDLTIILETIKVVLLGKGAQ